MSSTILGGCEHGTVVREPGSWGGSPSFTILCERGQVRVNLDLSFVICTPSLSSHLKKESDKPL